MLSQVLALLVLIAVACADVSPEARQAVPYMAHLMESRRSRYLPAVGLLPLSVETRRQGMTARFPGGHLTNSTANKVVLLLYSRRALSGQELTVCLHDQCIGPQRLHSPIPHNYVADVGMPLPSTTTMDLEVDVRGQNVRRLSVISLVFLETRTPPFDTRDPRSSGPVPSPTPTPNQSPVCHLEQWKVKMSELRWNNVLFPKQFTANICVGVCPLVDEVYSNHAFLRQMYNENSAGGNVETVPSPCCVPYEVESLRVLVYVQDIIEQKQYLDTIAKSCACL